MKNNKYTCKQSKDEIITILAEEFKRVTHDLDSRNTPENYGRYQAMMDLLQKVKIYENEE